MVVFALLIITDSFYVIFVNEKHILFYGKVKSYFPRVHSFENQVKTRKQAHAKSATTKLVFR